MKNNTNLLIRGIGIGVIAASLLFYFILTFSVPKANDLTNEEIISRAKQLGMVFVSDITISDKDNTTSVNPTEQTIEATDIQ